jgi:hypothetical protein
MLILRRILAPLLCGAFLFAWSTASHATLVTSRFSGTVTSYAYGFLDPNVTAIDDDHPLGTVVEWDLTFDDSFVALGYPGLFSVPPPAVSGSLQVGPDEYTFTGMRFSSLSFGADFNTILSYGAQMSAVGPGTSDGADFFAMFWSFGPDLSLVGAPHIGYGYSNDFGTVYGYVVASGDYSVGPANQVPEPATALLAIPPLALLWRRRSQVAKVR